MKFDGPASTLLRTVGKPPFVYGTAWKKDQTTHLVKEAVLAGFRVIDTAAQPKHYREDLVGDALRELYEGGKLKREDIFLQTKFTSISGQDPASIPYAANDPLESQICSSITSSLHNLRPRADPTSASETYLDAVLLHSPLPTPALTLAAWRVLESYVPHKIRHLGISNTSLEILAALAAAATVPPAVVQNRFYAETGYDVPLRQFCNVRGIVYQSFWTLTGNPALLRGGAVDKLSREAGVSVEVAMYALCVELGIAPLNGTTDATRMAGDIEGVGRVRNWSFVYASKWSEIVTAFREAIGQDERAEIEK